MAVDQKVLQKTNQLLEQSGLTVITSDLARPWGGFLVLDEAQILRFIQVFFPELTLEDAQHGLPMSPKILLVAPHQRLSWQYHHRRGELWQVIDGPVGVVASLTNRPGEQEQLAAGEQIQFQTQQRHRLIGLDGWGVVAEIWLHTNPAHPSDEADIVRIEDDYKRG